MLTAVAGQTISIQRYWEQDSGHYRAVYNHIVKYAGSSRQGDKLFPDAEESSGSESEAYQSDDIRDFIAADDEEVEEEGSSDEARRDGGKSSKSGRGNKARKRGRDSSESESQESSNAEEDRRGSDSDQEWRESFDWAKVSLGV